MDMTSVMNAFLWMLVNMALEAVEDEYSIQVSE